MSIVVGTGDLAKYPFLEESREFLKDFQWSDFNDLKNKHIIEKSAKRVIDSAEGVFDSHLDKFEVELFAFLAGLMICRVIGIESFTKKYAMTEARRIQQYLVRDAKGGSADEIAKSRLLVLKIMKDVTQNADIQIKQVDRDRDSKYYTFAMDVVDYLMRTADLHSPKWKLSSRKVCGGFVYIDSADAVRLVRDELAFKIAEQIRKMKLPDRDEVKLLYDRALELKAQIEPRLQSGTVRFNGFMPPCMTVAMAKLSAGENLSHNGRLLVATYLLAIGKTVDETIEAFKNAPDFKMNVSKYQIEQLAGQKGSRTKYIVPNCEKLKTQNLCHADDFCKNIKNPLSYRRRERQDG